MNIQTLNKEQQKKLLTMCKELFPEYKTITTWDLSNYDDFCGLGGDVFSGHIVAFYEGEAPLKNGNYDFEKFREPAKQYIHWHQLCFGELAKRIWDVRVIDKYSNDSNYKVGLVSVMATLSSNPVDYLYDFWNHYRKGGEYDTAMSGRV